MMCIQNDENGSRQAISNNHNRPAAGAKNARNQGLAGLPERCV
jgi:hypothetical protein